MKKTLIIGASTKTDRYSYKATKMLKEYDHEVQLLAKREADVLGEKILDDWSRLDLMNLDTVTLYISSKFQAEYYDKILDLNPNRVIFNPGTENPEFYKLLKERGVFYTEACTLVLLRTGQY